MRTTSYLAVSSADPHAVAKALEVALEQAGPALFIHAPDSLSSVQGELPEDVALVIETSGSTGRPKQVWYPREALLYAASMTSEAIGDAGVWWLALPTHYIAGLQVLVRSIIMGTQPIVAPAFGSLPQRFFESLGQIRAARDSGLPVYTSLVPTQLADLLNAVDSGEVSREDFGLFSHILVGGQRVPDELVARAREHGVRVTKTYGMAETSGGCVWDGVALPGVGIDRVDGCIALSGQMLAGGYIGGTEHDQASFIQRGDQRWFVTRDLGEVIGGALLVTGRLDDVIISGGQKVSLGAIEESLRQELGLEDVVVVSVSDERWGQVPIVVTTAALSREEVREVAQKSLGVAARPERILVVERIPLLSSGKPDREALKALAHAAAQEGESRDER